ncbi:DUF3618 domain-containing protein [Sphingomonas sp. DT-51]|uniref:DUF3618 domain-containing protein n=1 Tax=Sphingomonas sp. DT-51 TaxID=3396165 RepID=UPI003F1B9E83
MNAELSDTDQIEQDLAQTRKRLDQRLDALQGKMAPAQIVNDTFAHLGGDDGAAFTGRLIDKAKANPLAVGLVGLGFVWLLATREPNGTAHGIEADELSMRLRSAESRVVRAHDEHEDAYRERLDAVRGSVLGIERHQDEPAGSYADRIKSAVRSARHGLSDVSQHAGASVAHAYSSITGQLGRHAHNLQQGSGNMAQNTQANISSLTSNPIALGGLAAVAGLIVGSLLPTSETEERAFGATAGKLKAAASDAAQELADKGGQVVNQALDTARDSAAREGLTADRPIGEAVAALKSGELAESVRHVAADVLETGKAAAGDAEQTRSRPEQG